MFLDDTACNLASLNLTKFLGEDGSFDVEGYRHAVRVFFMAQEILVDFSSLPDQARSRKNSHDYRPLGLGYANLGTLLMLRGIPYDSDEGRAIAGALTAIMCGHAYEVSAEMAAAKGPFAGFAKNREPMLRVMGMHRDAAYAIDRDTCPEDALARRLRGLGRGGAPRPGARLPQRAGHGARAHRHHRPPHGLRHDRHRARLRAREVQEARRRRLLQDRQPVGARGAAAARLLARPRCRRSSPTSRGTNTLLAAPHVNRASLKARGLTDDDLAKVEAALPGVVRARPRLRPVDPRRGGVRSRSAFPRSARARSGFSLLQHLGFTRAEIEEANDDIIGRMTVEGAPHLRPEHYAVFDCANRCGKKGQRFLAPMSHVRMMAAAQPFLSGAISKTVNLPNDATVDDVQRDLRRGLAARPQGGRALPRRLQGVAAALVDVERRTTRRSRASRGRARPRRRAESHRRAHDGRRAPVARPTGTRVRLPKKRHGFTQEARVGGHKIFLRTGEYDDGTLGEIFIDMHKEGAAFRSLMNCFAMAVSVGLQYGVPLETFVEQFTFTRFEPQGIVEGTDNIKFATSIVDYLFRVLGVEYLHRYDLAHVPPTPTSRSRRRSSGADRSHRGPDGARDPAPSSSAAAAAASRPAATRAEARSALDAQLEDMMGDAPVCDGCGHITVRNGACYKCLNCGNSMGCS